MSTAALEMSQMAGDEAGLQYRALHTGALIGLVLGLLSVFVAITAASSFAGCLLVAPIPLAGIVVSLWSLSKIGRYPDQYTGRGLAKTGFVLSLVFLISGVSYGGYVYVTEVPDGYTRISFNTMKPDELQERAGIYVPPDIEALKGKKVFIKGFIRQDSISQSSNFKDFLLVRDNQQCCFGDISTVKYYDRIRVYLTQDMKLKYSPTRVYSIGGVLDIEPANIGHMASNAVFFLNADYAN